MAVQVSVIVPVYNAAEFVGQAIRSALEQPETAEVLLVEDASLDASLAVCNKLAVAHDRVRVLRHPGGTHRGPGASRNLGIASSRCEQVAFLDADDVYLPGRFVAAAELLEGDSTLDGVYEAITCRSENDASMQRWTTAGRLTNPLTTVNARVAPEQLLVLLTSKGGGYFHLNGLTVRRTAFDKTGLFDEHLDLHQDTALILKLAAVARLAPGRLDKPVAIRRIHEHNRISAPRSAFEVYRAKEELWMTLWHWTSCRPDPDKRRIIAGYLLKRMLMTFRSGSERSGFLVGLRIRARLLRLPLNCPSLIRHAAFGRRGRAHRF